MLLPLLLALLTQAQDTTHLVIVSTTDVHGQATGWNYLAGRAADGGLSRAARVVDSLRARYPGRVVLLDAGDALQGDPFAAYFARVAPRDPHPVLDAMGAMGYDAATPGDHDFDFGAPWLFRSIRAASFPFVSANLYTLPQDTLALAPYALVRRGGVRIAVTGLTTPAAAVGNRAAWRNQLRVGRLADAAPGVLPPMAANADLSIVLLHGGIAGRSTHDTTGLGPEHDGAALAYGAYRPHLVVVGHSHGELADSVINGVHFVQPGPEARSLSVMHVTLRRTADGWRPSRFRGELVPLAAVPPSEAIARRLQPDHDAVRRWVAQPLGNVAADMPASTGRAEALPLTAWINDVQRRAAGASLSVTPVPDLPAGLRAGVVTLGQLFALYPGEQTLRTVRVTGGQVKDLLEHSASYYAVDPQGRVRLNDSVSGRDVDILGGAEYSIDLRLPVGSRVRSLSVRGRPVQPLDQFTLAVAAGRHEGAGTYSMLAGAPTVEDQGDKVRDLLAADIRTRGVLDPSAFSGTPWRIIPAELALAARRLFAPTPDLARPGTPRDTILLRIFAIGDFHGALLPRVRTWSGERPVGGMPALKRLMDSLTIQCACPDLRVDAGDEMQGTLASNLEFGRSTVLAMNLLGIDAAVIGNHDFDWSVDTLLRRMAEARYPWLLANVVDSATGRRPDWAIPWRILPAGRLRVGFLGYITPETRSIVRGDLLRGLAFTGPASLAEPLAQLRAERPDLVVLLAHEGASCEGGPGGACAGAIIDLARSLDSGSVDLIVAGHRHQLTDTRVRGIPIVQTGSSGGDVGVIDIVQTLVGSREVRTRLVPVYADSIGADSAMAGLVEGFRRRSDSLASRVVATLKTPAPRSAGQYPLGNLVADAHRNALRTDFGLMNNGGIRTGLPAGPVNYSQVFEVSPFGNELVRIRLTGGDMRAILEQILADGTPGAHVSGLQVRYEPGRPRGQRVREIRLPNGKRMDDRATYTLAVNDFLAGGKDGFAMLAGLPQERTGIVDTDALVNYLRRLPQPVELPADDRFILRR